MKRSILLLAVSFLLISCSGESTPDQKFDKTPVALETRIVTQSLDHPWELAWGPDNTIWFTERNGRIGKVDPETGTVTSIFDVPDVWQEGESGVLGLALHPSFQTTPHLFVVYTYDNNGTKQEKVVRYTYNGSTLVEPVILVNGISAYPIHDGSRLLIHDNKLFITTGDAGDAPSAQDTDDLNGKILRVNLDGSIPGDNPIAGSPLWSWGHRNPQGLTLGSNGLLYSSEHGPANDDEVNIIEKGRNYGWPTVHGYCDNQIEQAFCQQSNIVEPIAAYTPTLAVCGMVYYGKTLIPQWNNALLLMTLKEEQMMILNLSSDGRSIDSQTKAFDGEFGRLRAICIAPDGRVFFSSSSGNSRDKIIEVKPAQMDKREANSEVVK